MFYRHIHLANASYECFNLRCEVANSFLVQIYMVGWKLLWIFLFTANSSFILNGLIKLFIQIHFTNYKIFILIENSMTLQSRLMGIMNYFFTGRKLTFVFNFWVDLKATVKCHSLLASSVAVWSSHSFSLFDNFFLIFHVLTRLNPFRYGKKSPCDFIKIHWKL